MAIASRVFCFVLVFLQLEEHYGKWGEELKDRGKGSEMPSSRHSTNTAIRNFEQLRVTALGMHKNESINSPTRM